MTPHDFTAGEGEPTVVVALSRVDKGAALFRSRGHGYVFHPVTEPKTRPAFKARAA